MAERGNIQTFTSPVDSLRPSEYGAEALARVGRTEEAQYRFAGEQYSRGFQNLADPVAKYIEQHDTMSEISKGSAVLAAMHNNFSTQWNEMASKSDPNDPSIQGKFLNDTVEPELQKFQAGFHTERGQQWALDRANEMRSHYYNTTSADMISRDGKAAINDATTFLQQSANAAYRDPQSADLSFKQIDAYFDAARQHFEGSREQLEQMDKMQYDAKNEVAKNVIKGYADSQSPNGMAAAKALLDSGRFDKWMKPDEASQLNGYITAQRITKAVEAQQKREAAQYKNTVLSKAETQNIFSDLASGKDVSAMSIFSNSALSKEQKTDFLAPSRSDPGILMLPRAWLSSPEYGQGFAATAEAIQQGQEVTPAGLTKGVRMFLTNPGQAITPAGAAKLQEIQDKLKTPDGAREVNAQLQTLNALKTQYMPGGSYANDPNGQRAYAKMQSSFFNLWDSEIKSGKSIAQLTDPDSKDYIGNALKPARSSAQALADITAAKPPSHWWSGWFGSSEPAIPEPAKRQVGKIYPTPQGGQIWTGTGWRKPPSVPKPE